jgi:hypothetical protein
LPPLSAGSASSSTPIFVPNLEPFTCYNTRYGLAALGAGGGRALFARTACWGHGLLGGMSWWILSEGRSVDLEGIASELQASGNGPAATPSRHYDGGGCEPLLGDPGVFQQAGIPLLNRAQATDRCFAQVYGKRAVPASALVLARSGDRLHKRWCARLRGPRYGLVRSRGEGRAGGGSLLVARFPTTE